MAAMRQTTWRPKVNFRPQRKTCFQTSGGWKMYSRTISSFSHHWSPLTHPSPWRGPAAPGRTATSATRGARSTPGGGSSPRRRRTRRAWPPRPTRTPPAGSSVSSSIPDPQRRPPAPPWSGASTGERAAVHGPGRAEGSTPRRSHRSTNRCPALLHTRRLLRSAASWHTQVEDKDTFCSTLANKKLTVSIPCSDRWYSPGSEG